MLFLIVPIALIFLKFADWEAVLRLVWFCNMLVTASNAATRLSRVSHNFLASIVILAGVDTLSLILGWLLGGV